MRYLQQAELKFATLMRECEAIRETLKGYEILILGSKHPTVLFTDPQTQNQRKITTTSNISP